MDTIEPRNDWEPAVGAAAQAGASDILLASGQLPLCRIQGQWVVPAGAGNLEVEMLLSWIRDMAPEESWKELEREGETVFVRVWGDGRSRLRSSIRRHENEVMLALRLIPQSPPTPKELGLPPVFDTLIGNNSGIIIFSGTPGSGRSTLLASAIDAINVAGRRRILFLGCPVEYQFANRKSWIETLEIRQNSGAIARLLAESRFHDYDVVAVDAPMNGEEILDLLLLGQAGILVMLVASGSKAARVLEELVSRIPGAGRQSLARGIISEHLRGIFIQMLLKRGNGQGLLPAHEILVQSRSLYDSLREGKWASIPQIMSANRQGGTVVMDDSIDAYLFQGQITGQEAYQKAQDKPRFQQYGPPEWQQVGKT